MVRIEGDVDVFQGWEGAGLVVIGVLDGLAEGGGAVFRREVADAEDDLLGLVREQLLQLLPDGGAASDGDDVFQLLGVDVVGQLYVDLIVGTVCSTLYLI